MQPAVLAEGLEHGDTRTLVSTETVMAVGPTGAGSGDRPDLDFPLQRTRPAQEFLDSELLASQPSLAPASGQVFVSFKQAALAVEDSCLSSWNDDGIVADSGCVRSVATVPAQLEHATPASMVVAAYISSASMEERSIHSSTVDQLHALHSAEESQSRTSSTGNFDFDRDVRSTQRHERSWSETADLGAAHRHGDGVGIRASKALPGPTIIGQDLQFDLPAMVTRGGAEGMIASALLVNETDPVPSSESSTGDPALRTERVLGRRTEADAGSAAEGSSIDVGEFTSAAAETDSKAVSLAPIEFEAERILNLPGSDPVLESGFLNEDVSILPIVGFWNPGYNRGIPLTHQGIGG